MGETCCNRVASEFMTGYRLNVQERGLNMAASSKILQLLKCISIAGMTLNALGFLAFLVILLVQQDTMAGTQIWVVMWFISTLGIPMFGMLYVAIKMREYLRDISASLLKQGS